MSLLQVQSLFGIVLIITIAWLLSEKRHLFGIRMVAGALGLQIGLVLLLLYVPGIRDAVFSVNVIVSALQQATQQGTAYMFGFVGGAPPPFPLSGDRAPILAFEILPLVLVVSALSALLWHWRILPLLVRGISVALQKTMGIGGAVGLGTAANVFIGMIESPLLIRPYLAKISRGELFTILTVGLATVSGTVLVLYGAILEPSVPGAVGHIIAASLISLPAAIMIARIMIPSDTITELSDADARKFDNSLEALTRGTQEGLQLFLSVVAMLLVIVALVALANQILAIGPDIAGQPLTVERALGWVFAPIAWSLGVPVAEMTSAGSLLGTKTILNEFVAYLNLAALEEGVMSDRSRLILLYAMCGFANLGSVGIMIAGVSSMVPERQSEVIELCSKAIISGTLSTLMTGAIIGVVTAP